MRVSWLVLLPLLLFFYLALSSMVTDSPTMDEQNHLARGLALLGSGDPRFSLEHPPLVNVLSAAPVAVLERPVLPFDDPSWNQREGWYAFADRLLWSGRVDVDRVVFLARLPIVFLAMGLAVLALHFARDIWRRRSAGLAAFALVLFDPNLLAHGRYITTDLGGALFVLLAVWAVWRLWQVRQTAFWMPWLTASLALGLAFGSKHSTLLLLPILAVLALLPLYGQAWRPSAVIVRLGQLATAAVTSLLVVWGAYAFQWGRFAFAGDRLSWLNRYSGPMPTYWAGIEQIADISASGRAAYLLGKFSDSGFLAYFPVAFSVKTPLAVLALVVGGGAALILWNRTRERALYLLIAAALFLLATMQSGLNIGYRHLLPMLPLCYVAVSGLAAWRPRSANGRSPALVTGQRLLLLAVAGSLLATVRIHPYYLSYFNWPSGGPSHGHEILTDSNIDWGQDLKRLTERLAGYEATPVKLGWFGTADPAYYGLSYEPLPGLPRQFELWWQPPFNPEDPEPGLYAISVSNLTEPPLRVEEKRIYSWFRDREPDARVGYSIRLYYVP